MPREIKAIIIQQGIEKLWVGYAKLHEIEVWSTL